MSKQPKPPAAADVPAAALSLAPDHFGPEEIRLVKQVVAPDLTDGELSLFMAVCRSRGLNPFNPGQIFAIKRFDRARGEKRMTIQIGVDGFRLMADRTGLYQGQSPEEFCAKDLRWTEVWDGNGPPFAARIGLHRRGWPNPQYAIARYASYVQLQTEGKYKGQPTHMWRSKADVMLAKCAEVRAFRKAFPLLFDDHRVLLQPTMVIPGEDGEIDAVVDLSTGEVCEPDLPDDLPALPAQSTAVSLSESGWGAPRETAQESVAARVGRPEPESRQDRLTGVLGKLGQVIDRNEAESAPSPGADADTPPPVESAGSRSDTVSPEDEGPEAPALDEDVEEEGEELPPMVVSFGSHQGLAIDDPDLPIEFLEFLAKNEKHPQQEIRGQALAQLQKRREAG